LQYPLFTMDDRIEDIVHYMNAKIGYAQVSLCDDWNQILQNVLSGPVALFIDGFAQAVLIDVRTYPTRSIGEPDTERITKGARDGFVETMLFNANLIRRRVRSPHLTFALHKVGNESQTDVAIAYLDNQVNEELLESLSHTLQSLDITALTMGSKSLEELLVPKKWWHPMPSILQTERPDLACSYLSEGHILILVDNSPIVLILPCTIFQFTQSPEDYYKSPLIGNYIRFYRFLCGIISLFLLPVFLLLSMNPELLPPGISLLPTGDMTPLRIFISVLFAEIALDLFRYSSSHSPEGFSGALAIVGGLLIGDVAVKLEWASSEIIFYAAATVLASLSISSIEFSEAVRMYRFLLLLSTGLCGLFIPGFFGFQGGLAGFLLGLALVILSIVTTPGVFGKSYFWPLIPFNWRALRTLLFRYPVKRKQPPQIWSQRK